MRLKPDWPDEFSAHRAESGLSEECGDELVVLYEVDLGLLDGPSSTVQGRGLFLLHNLLTLCHIDRNAYLLSSHTVAEKQRSACIHHKLIDLMIIYKNPQELFMWTLVKDKITLAKKTLTECVYNGGLKLKGMKNTEWKPGKLVLEIQSEYHHDEWGGWRKKSSPTLLLFFTFSYTECLRYSQGL